ncbi:isocyanide synthase family protein [Pendulispora rubella]|uniref:Isocyanide synthase family protein n=1 Tax=Pendulispora rubella TaxID=2741070 RepID=A0ABZ2L398_9BACT
MHTTQTCYGTRPSTGLDIAAPEEAWALGTQLLMHVMRVRRVPAAGVSCGDSPCAECLAPHLARVVSAIANREPVSFILPAFPGKSPNPTKVLGPMPDMAEQRSLEFLASLCERIRREYAPGARVVLCSDGRVFNDIVGIRDIDITGYQHELSAMISRISSSALATFNLDQVFAGLSFEAMRERLMQEYGESLEALRDAVRAGGEPHRLYCGITRFLVEDATRPDGTASRSALQRECRRRAYEVIRRSQAWGRLLEVHFPQSVRLSIHPQTCGSEKLGIHMMETADSWLTPWHGVAVDMGGHFVLLKRAEAEALGARVVAHEGRASHYELTGAS